MVGAQVAVEQAVVRVAAASAGVRVEEADSRRAELVAAAEAAPLAPAEVERVVVTRVATTAEGKVA